MKKVFSLLICLMLVMSLAIPAFAAENDITYQGESRILITPADTTYTDTDLFGNFKGVMPGDVLLEEVKIVNAAIDCDYVKVYLRAIPHSATNLPSRKVLEAGETLASMNDFLQQLHLEISIDGEVVFQGTPNQGSDSIYVGKLDRLTAETLDVVLTVPKLLGNEYAHREGEVDWEFTFEEGNYPAGEPPKTGDYIMMAVGVMAVSAVALLIIFAMKRKKKA